ncbi:hypothetical protein ACFQWH_09260 [Mycolicibacterium sp. GCM10028919]|uniref:hypothetical protein n=1 Tax=Mycolicibacterium sp. GCM10028919 TaxID=3273401 RepID=UPI00360EE305
MTVPEFDQLVAQWKYWTNIAGIAHVSVDRQDGVTEIGFRSDEGAYFLRRDGDWWSVDETDDRGKTYPATVSCSTVPLAQKYLIWTWATTARTVIGAPQLGRRFQQQGFNTEVHSSESSRANFVQLITPNGTAEVPGSKSIILSHVMPMPLAQLIETLGEGL